jgi:multiple sugar transport system substrate-binding protein
MRTANERDRFASARRWVPIFAALVALVGAACTTSAKAGPPQLQWYINPDDGGQTAIAQRCTAAAHGRYEINTALLPRDASDQREQLLRRLAAEDSSIDLMSLDPVFVDEFAQAGFLAPIARSDAPDLTKGVVQPAITGATWRGRLVTVPMWANTQVLWYRKSVARKAGLDMSKPVTWSQIIDAAQRTGTTVAVQAALYEGYSVLINALIESAGGRILDNPGASADRIKLGIASPAGEQAANVIHQLVARGVGGESLSTEDEEAGREMFQGSTGGFMVNWAYVWRAALAAVGDGSLSKSVLSDIGWTRYPRVDANLESRPPLGGIDLGIGHWSQDPDLALEAARCITSTENETFYFLHDGNPPARASVFSDPKVLKEFPMAPLLRESLEGSAPRPQTQYYGDLSSALQRSWHPPESVGPQTPATSATFVRQVIEGERLV